MKVTKISFVLLVFAIGLICHQLAEAQNAIRSSAFGNGGGVMEDGDRRIIGTLGQTLIGVSGSPSNFMFAGFWYTMGLPLPVHSIELTSPNGGEVWCSGSQYAIDWVTTGVGIARVHLQYSTNGGVDYQDITTYPHLPNTGTYQWTVPQVSSTTVLVKAIGKDAGDNPLADDVSNANFTIQMPQIGASPASFTFSATPGGANPSPKTLNITNPGCGTLNWTATDDAAWLSLSPASGDTTTETDEVTVSVDITGLTEGTYNADITITSTNASNSPRNLPVTLNLYTGHVLSISLYQGFNLFSVPFYPLDTDLDVALAGIMTSMDSILALRDGQWKVSAPNPGGGGWGIDQVKTLNGGEAYIIYMKAQADLDLAGIPLVPDDVPVNLEYGFNLAPYNSTSEKTVEVAFAGIRDDVDSFLVYNAAEGKWKLCVPNPAGGWHLKQFSVVKPGWGLIIYLKADSSNWDVEQ